MDEKYRIICIEGKCSKEQFTNKHMIEPRASVQGCKLVFFIKEDEKCVVEEAESMKYPL